MSDHFTRRGFVKTVGLGGAAALGSGAVGSGVVGGGPAPAGEQSPKARFSDEKIRIGTLVRHDADGGPANYIRQILPYGFESFSLVFGRHLTGIDLAKMAAALKEVLAPSDAVMSSISIYGNPLVDDVCRDGWRRLIDATDLFGCKIVAGFAGRIVDKPLPDSMPRFAEVFGPLAKQAADRGVRLAFENCEMGGTWDRGDWNIAHGPAAWELMFNAVPQENIGLQWEPSHQMVKLIDHLPQLRKYVQRVYHLHGKDATIRWEVIREFGIVGPKTFSWHRTPGFGDCNWTDVITILRRGGFTGSIDIEGWHDPVYRDHLEMTGQVAALSYLKRCRGGSFVPNPT